MQEYLLIEVSSEINEVAAAFSQRLSKFWTQVLRNTPDDFEKVYAESSKFETGANLLTRKYAILPEFTVLLKTLLENEGFSTSSIDPDDLYSGYEITSPDWMHIEH